jgi:hypothetical protein
VLDTLSQVPESNEGNNQVSYSWNTQAPFDLVALEAYLRDQPGDAGNIIGTPTVGQNVYFHFKWRCDGSGTTPTFRLELRLDGSMFAYGVLSATGGYSYVTWANSAWTATAGSHTLTCVLDTLSQVPESNEGNNQVSYSWNTAGAKQWTLMVYSDGDNNLEPYAISDFLRLAGIGSTNDVNIVVEMDRIPGYSPDYGDWTDCKRFFITKDLTPTPGNAIQDLGEVNMGSPNTLQDFASWGVQNYPASRYCLVLSDHGSGCVSQQVYFIPKGVCFDDTSGGDCLTLPELGQALSGVSKIMDVIFFDACDMGMIEVAYQIKDCASFIVGSEEVGWAGIPGYYNTLASTLTTNPSILPSNFASAIVTIYINWIGGSLKATMSATDSSKLSSLKTATDNFAQKLKGKEDTFHDQISSARSDTEGYEGPLQNYYGYYIDLYHFAQLVYERISDTEIRNAASDVMNQLSSAIIKKGHCQHPNSNGLSIFFPDTIGKYNTFQTAYGSTSFAADTQWDEFVKYHLEYTPTTYDVTIIAHCNTQGADVAVPITMDGSPTGFNTPHTFSVTGTHTFTVPATDTNSHPFSQWNIGEATATITVTSAGTYTAYYGPSFTIWTEGYKTSYHIGETMKVYVRVRNPGPALPARARIYLQLPGGAFHGPLLDLTTTLPANYDSGKVLWQTFTIPSAPVGNYAWAAGLTNPTTSALISQSKWSWQLLAVSTMETQSFSDLLRIVGTGSTTDFLRAKPE